MMSKAYASMSREELLSLKEELDNSTVAKFATVQTEGNRKIQRSIEYYNLDMIISVGYRVKSQNGVIFRKWATSILKDYMMKGYAINEKRIEVLNKTVSIQSRMLASTLGIEEKEVLNVIEAYSNALSLLDDYDHGCISKPKGKDSIYQLTYEECRTLIDSMKYGGFSDVFLFARRAERLSGGHGGRRRRSQRYPLDQKYGDPRPLGGEIRHGVPGKSGFQSVGCVLQRLHGSAGEHPRIRRAVSGLLQRSADAGRILCESAAEGLPG